MVAIRFFLSLSLVVLAVDARSPLWYGNFSYQSQSHDGRGPVTITFDATKDGRGMFSIECERRFEDGRFKLRWPRKDHTTLHRFRKRRRQARQYRRWRRRAKAVCRKLRIKRNDFRFFFVNYLSDVVTHLGGKRIILKRQWSRLNEGNYYSDDSNTLFRMRYKVQADGLVNVRLQCKESDGDAGYKLCHVSDTYRLVKDDDGYELTDIPGGETVEDLLSRFKKARPAHASLLDHMVQSKRVKFANADVMYAMGDYVPNRLYRAVP
ncbi:hypothetical protein FOZ61_009153 [Perkinsus olseni]|uniref:Uncharacterized protein n=1 Tax=Perkinsus olseni TaxID=32597 RepID=A0A7J6L160_PEROL|nr:hypothetical protein FOZ61_009153 [Perkinsus olseni]KAF4655387.1 hypothetical protein FOL46_008268 [Perkinsus olseni]